LKKRFLAGAANDLILLDCRRSTHKCRGACAIFVPFLQLRRSAEERIQPLRKSWAAKIPRPGDEQEIMEETAQKSCWGLTAKAVIGFAGVILFVWLVGGGSETAAVLATAG
jgi:hypothetical protein